MTEINGPTVPENIHHAPSPERQEFVASEIGEAYKILLTNGGMISQSGRIMAFTFNDLRSENLKAEQAAELSERYTVRLRSAQVEDVMPEERRPRSTYVYIVRSGLFERIVYRRKRNSDWFYIRKMNSDGEIEDETITINPNLAEALMNYSTKILEAEGIRTPGFPVAKYSSDILRKLIDKRDEETSQTLP